MSISELAYELREDEYIIVQRKGPVIEQTVFRGRKYFTMCTSRESLGDIAFDVVTRNLRIAMQRVREAE